MFFNQKEYSEEAEKNRQKNDKQKDQSFTYMLTIGLLATFPPTRWLLRLHKRKIIDKVTYEKRNPKIKEQIPIFYIHGFRGGDYTTNIMVQQAGIDKGSSKYLKVTSDLFGNIKMEGTWTNDRHPIVQLVFKQRVVGVYAICYYLRFTLNFLSKKFKFKQYDAVAHSLGAPSVIKTEMQTFYRRHFPRLRKAALIAGPFNGVMYLGDIPNVNKLNENGRPLLMSPSYIGMLINRYRFNPDISILNIYGNVLDETNTDRFISVISAKSIRYILAPISHTFQEVEIRGSMAEHSMMHDNLMVINIVDTFLGIKQHNIEQESENITPIF
ncbi:putative alpha/beta hydrolase family protein [Lactobacillus colini]|uniref:Alpha/beta hydrolase family protein n=1 Tax=Lactobacillus colini TaxID=1819254 RepID=A0ABS4MCR3_9LACO|nr:alpha/beta hydrolase [Lactobacillus colini]MBP2057473.1 putative alpha/beta hydrolase family protein [Lactobacillus colini]